MIALWILLGIIAFILLLLCLPVYIEASYKERLELSVRLLFIKLPLVPKREKKEKKPDPRWVRRLKKAAASMGSAIKKAAGKTAGFFEDKLGISLKRDKSKRKRKPRAEGAQSAEPEEKKKGVLGSLMGQHGFSGLMELITNVAGLAFKRTGSILRGVTIDRLELDVRIGSEDAADTAISYGRWCALLFPAIAVILGAVRRCRFRNVRISPDFHSGESSAVMHLRLHVFPLLVTHHALRFVLSLLWSEIKRGMGENMQKAQSYR